jgi:hypothetical protein
MIATRTTALMLAMATSLLATPAAFAQNFNLQDVDNTSTQNSVPIAIQGGSGINVAAGGDQDSDQGACQNAALADRGSDADAEQNEIEQFGLAIAGFEAENEQDATIDCS